MSAAKRLVSHAASIARGVLRSYVLGLVAGLLVLIAGLTIAIAVGGAVAIITGIGAAASALGVSWKGIASTLAVLAGHLRAPLWGAELDLAIGRAVTVPEARSAYATLPASGRRCDAMTAE